MSDVRSKSADVQTVISCLIERIRPRVHGDAVLDSLAALHSAFVRAEWGAEDMPSHTTPAQER